LVRFNIKDRSTGREFFNMLSWDFKLNTIEQPYINAPTSAVVGEEIQLDGSRSYLPDYEILQFIWQIGSKRTIGESITHTFVERGIQEIKLGVMVRHKATGIVRQVSVMKNIMVFNTRAEADSFKSRMKEESSSIQIKDYDHATVHVIYSAEDEFANNAEFVVEIANSKSRIPLNDPSFRKVPGRFQVKELFFPREKLFSYVVDRQMDLVSTFFIYNEMIAAGFKNTRVTTFALSDEAEKELFGIKRVFGLSTDIYFDSYNRLTSSAYLILDQLARLLNKYPGVRLGLTVHTDNSGSSQVSVQISQIRVKAMFNYLVNKGIDPRRLVSIGAGAERPIASNSNEAGRKMNRRLEVYIEK
jgi:outer membrane protein OmpA-like peptidoglycan-associated protein